MEEIRNLFLEVYSLLETEEVVHFNMVMNGAELHYYVRLSEASSCAYCAEGRLITLSRDIMTASDSSKLFVLAHEVGHTFNCISVVDKWVVNNWTKHRVLARIVRAIRSFVIEFKRAYLSSAGKVAPEEVEADAFAATLFPSETSDGFEFLENSARSKLKGSVLKTALRELETRKSLIKEVIK
jgi:hypothetical protein